MREIALTITCVHLVDGKGFSMPTVGFSSSLLQAIWQQGL
jgi:hypothetical protein